MKIITKTTRSKFVYLLPPGLDDITISKKNIAITGYQNRQQIFGLVTTQHIKDMNHFIKFTKMCLWTVDWPILFLTKVQVGIPCHIHRDYNDKSCRLHRSPQTLSGRLQKIPSSTVHYQYAACIFIDLQIFTVILTLCRYPEITCTAPINWL